MVTVNTVGTGPAIDVWDVNPEFPITVARKRRGVSTNVESVVSLSRQTALSVGDTSAKAELRRWTLRWSHLDSDGLARIRQLHELASGSSGLLLFRPTETPGTAAQSNLAPSPEDFSEPVWQPGTTDTTSTIDTTALPSGVGGSAYAIANDGAATDPAYIEARSIRFPRIGSRIVPGVFIQRPAASAASNFQLSVFNPDDNTEHYARFSWTGSAWIQAGNSGDVTPFLAAGFGSWTYVGFNGLIDPDSGTDISSSAPDRKFHRLYCGYTGAVNAGNSILVAGHQLEQFSPSENPTFAGAYIPTREHAYVRIVDNPLAFERRNSMWYRGEVTLEEVIGAPV